MPDITLITGNLTVSGSSRLEGLTNIKSGYINRSFIPFNPNNNTSTYDPKYLLSNGTESSLPFAFGPQPWPYATGVRIKFHFRSDANNVHQLNPWINGMKWTQVTGTSLSPFNLRSGASFVINKTGENFKLPWRSFNDVPDRFFIRADVYPFTAEERSTHLENSGMFAIQNNQKIGFGTFDPSEKIDINGNLKIENTGFFESIVINNQKVNVENIYNPTFVSDLNPNPILGSFNV